MSSSGVTPDDDALARTMPSAASASSASSASSDKAKLNDYLANQRTLLAWGRTGVAIMGLGFVVARFALLLRELGGAHPRELPTGVGSSFGIALTVFGAALVGLSLVRYLRIARGIKAGDPHVSPALDIAMAVGLVCAGLVLALYLALTS